MAKRKITIKKGIKKSVFKRKSYPKNEFSMTLMNRGEMAKKPHIYIYHSFEDKSSKTYSRWYDTNFLTGKYKLDDKKRTLTYIIPEWENETARGFTVSKNVPIVIHFTVKGWDKFTKTFNKFKEEIKNASKRKRKSPAKKKATKKRKSPAKKRTTKRKTTKRKR